MNEITSTLVHSHVTGSISEDNFVCALKTCVQFFRLPHKVSFLIKIFCKAYIMEKCNVLFILICMFYVEKQFHTIKNIYMFVK